MARIGCIRIPVEASPAIVDANRENVVGIPEVDLPGDVDAAGRDTVCVGSNLCSIDIESGALPNPLELDDQLVAGERRRNLEMLSVPRRSLVQAMVTAAMA